MRPSNQVKSRISLLTKRDVFGQVKGILCGHPFRNGYASAYEKVLQDFLIEALPLWHLSIIAPRDLGHIAPVIWDFGRD